MSLYKYTSANVGLKILSLSKIRFTQPPAFNDPFDTYPCLDELIGENKLQELLEMAFKENKDLMDSEYNLIAKQHYDMLPPEIKSQGTITDFINLSKLALLGETGSYLDFIFKYSGLGKLKSRMIDEFLSMLWYNIGVLCLSEKNDDLLMWSHYADSHRGMVIEFDETHPYFSTVNLNEGLWASKVTYIPNRPSIKFEEIQKNGHDINKVLSDIFCVKSEVWKYEQEYRVLRPLRNSDPYTDIYCGYSVHLFDFPPEAVKGVIFGCKILQEDKEKIFKILMDNKKFENVSMKQARIDTQMYKIYISNQL